jgi:SEFIR domain-containing protein
MSSISKKIFISYSHDTKEYKEQVRKLADTLRIDYGLDVMGDFYIEDNPAGKQLPDLMENIRSSDKVICLLSPFYKIKADEGKGGVGYEKTIITDELFNDMGSEKFIPISLCKDIDFKEIAPHFLTSTRKAILRNAYQSDEEFIEDVAREIWTMPKNPKPPLGKNKLLSQEKKITDATEIDIGNIIEPSSHEIIFKNALFYAKNNDETNFRLLLKRVKKKVFVNLILFAKNMRTLSILKMKLNCMRLWTNL